MFVIYYTFNVCNDFFHVVVGHFRFPSCADAICAINEHHGDDWQVILRLSERALTSVVELVALAEDETSERTELSEYVTRISRILAYCNEQEKIWRYTVTL